MTDPLSGAAAPIAPPTPAGDLVGALVAVLATLLPESIDRIETEIRPALSAAVDRHDDALLEKLRRADRLIHVGQRSAGVAHELRNPLAVIETSVFILTEWFHADPRALRHLGRISDQTAIATRIVHDLLDATRELPMLTVETDLSSVVHEAIGQFPRPPELTLQVTVAPRIAMVLGDARRLRQVVLNLLANACQSVDRTGTVTVTLASEGPMALLTVADNGHGIPVDLLPRLFEPLVTTRRTGTGLGLALSRDIALAHGGDLVAANSPDSGAVFTLLLPLATASMAP